MLVRVTGLYYIHEWMRRGVAISDPRSPSSPCARSIPAPCPSAGPAGASANTRSARKPASSSTPPLTQCHEYRERSALRCLRSNARGGFLHRQPRKPVESQFFLKRARYKMEPAKDELGGTQEHHALVRLLRRMPGTAVPVLLRSFLDVHQIKMLRDLHPNEECHPDGRQRGFL